MSLDYVKLPFTGTHILKNSSTTWCGKNIFRYNSLELCSSSKKPCKKCVAARGVAEKEKATGE